MGYHSDNATWSYPELPDLYHIVAVLVNPGKWEILSGF
jgi:hypothetical protein